MIGIGGRELSGRTGLQVALVHGGEAETLFEGLGYILAISEGLEEGNEEQEGGVLSLAEVCGYVDAIVELIGEGDDGVVHDDHVRQRAVLQDAQVFQVPRALEDAAVPVQSMVD